jgi:hypothetical protein
MQEAKRVEKAEAKRLRDEAKKQKDLEKEDRNAQRLANRQLHSDSKAQKQQNRGGVAMATRRGASVIPPTSRQHCTTGTTSTGKKKYSGGS